MSRVIQAKILWVAGGRKYGLTTEQKALMALPLWPYADAGWFLITGGALGADQAAEMLWRRWEKPYIVQPARWATQGKLAGPIRNRVIADFWKPDLLITFPGGTGTADARDVAEMLGIEHKEGINEQNQ